MSAVLTMESLRSELQGRREAVQARLVEFDELVALRDALDAILATLDGSGAGPSVSADAVVAEAIAEEEVEEAGEVVELADPRTLQGRMERVLARLIEVYGMTQAQADRVVGGSFLTRDLSATRRVGIVACLALGATKGQAGQFWNVQYGTVDDAVAKVGANPGAKAVAEEIVDWVNGQVSAQAEGEVG